MTTKEKPSPSAESAQVPEPTIGVGLIVRNAEKTIETCIRSLIDHVEGVKDVRPHDSRY